MIACCLVTAYHMARRAASAAARQVGTLYLVATPLGNPRDLSLRGFDVLSRVPCIAAEDTRVIAALLAHHGIPTEQKRIVSCNNEHDDRKGRSAWVVSRLLAGDSVALVSGAGTPGISDPGHLVVAAARAAGLPVSPIPGPCAAIAAASALGVPHGPGGILLLGFLPDDGRPAAATARHSLLVEIATAHRSRTVVLHVPPGAVAAVCADLASVHASVRGPLFGQQPRGVLLARELTKPFEQLGWFGSLEEAAAAVGLPGEGGALNISGSTSSIPARGEFTLVLAPMDVALPVAPASSGDTHDDAASVLDALDAVRGLVAGGLLRPSEAVARVAAASGVDRKALYRAVAAADSGVDLVKGRGGGAAVVRGSGAEIKR